MKIKFIASMMFAVFILAAVAVLLLSCGNGNNQETNYNVKRGTQANGHFTISPISAKAGAAITLTPYADPSYQFDSWSFNPPGNTTATDKGNGTWTFPMPGYDVTVSAVFVPEQSSECNVIQGTHENGDFTINPNSAKSGATITLTPTADDGYRFDSWSFDPPGTTLTTNMGNGTWTFPMPGYDVTVNAVFVSDQIPVSEYDVIQGTHENGDFTINPNRASGGTTITLTPAADNGYQIAGWSFNPAGNTTATHAGNGTWTFIMPDNNVTVNAVFIVKPVAGTGTKTVTVVGGIGKIEKPLPPNTPQGEDHADGTRHITVTVTMANGVITNVVLDHILAYLTGVGNNYSGENYSSENWMWYYTTFGGQTFVNEANRLATAIKNANNPDVAFAAPTNLSVQTRDGWPKHEAAIRQAVKDAVKAINEGKPNGVFAGGGKDTAWTINGVPFSGEAVITGVSYMSGPNKPTMGYYPTDTTVEVKVTNGFITGVEYLASAECECTDVSSKVTIRSLVMTTWPNAIKAKNTWEAVDILTGATISAHMARNIVKKAVEKIAYEGE